MKRISCVVPPVGLGFTPWDGLSEYRIVGDWPTSRVVTVIGPSGSGLCTPPTHYWPSAHPVRTLVRDPSVKEARIFKKKRKVYWERKFLYLFDVLRNYLRKWICGKIVVLTEPLAHEYFLRTVGKKPILWSWIGRKQRGRSELVGMEPPLFVK